MVDSVGSLGLCWCWLLLVAVVCDCNMLDRAQQDLKAVKSHEIRSLARADAHLSLCMYLEIYRVDFHMRIDISVVAPGSSCIHA